MLQSFYVNYGRVLGLLSTMRIFDGSHLILVYIRSTCDNLIIQEKIIVKILITSYYLLVSSIEAYRIQILPPPF